MKSLSAFVVSLLILVATVQAQDTSGLLLGPSLTAPSPTSVNVWWHLASESANHTVEYGKTRDLGMKATSTEGTRYPQIELTGLENGAKYYYRVVSGAEHSDMYEFTLPKADEPLNIVFWADNQSGYQIFTDKTVPKMTELQPDLLITAGDLVDRGGVYEQWGQQLYGPARELFRTVPWYPVRGNHDYNGGAELANDMLKLPNNSHWYAVSYGPLRLVFMDTNVQDEAQLQWLAAEVGSREWNAARFRVVVFHHPPFTSLWDNPGYDGEALLRALVVPMLEANGADLLVNGHAHDYERLERNRPDGGKMHYLIIGGGGGALDTIDVHPWPFSVLKFSRHHVLQAEVDNERMVIRAIDTNDGSDLDLFQIRSSGAR